MSHTRPLVSVVIPTYNRERTIARAIRSVLSQTYRDLELIVVDDASHDATRKRVETFTDPRLRYIGHTTNLGGSAARNTGIEQSRGEYLAFLDSDDEWLPTKLEAQLPLFRSSPSLGIVYCSATYLTGAGAVVRHRVARHRGNVYRQLLLSNEIVGSTSAAVVPRAVLGRIGGFDVDLPARQDIDLWVRIAREYTVDFVADPLVQIDQGDRGDRISASQVNKLRARELFLEKHRADLRREGVEHVYLRDTARLYQSRLGASACARGLYLQAIRAHRGDALSYLGLASTYVPGVVLRSLLRLRRGSYALAHVIRSAPRPQEPVNPSPDRSLAAD